MAIEQFQNGESLATVRSKLNANDAELNSRLTTVETAVTGAYVKPVSGIPEADLSTAVVTKLNATGGANAGANTNITSMSGVTGGISEADFIRFDVTPETTSLTPGSMYWDSAENAQTLAIVMAGTAGTTLQVGQEQYYRIKASTAITDAQVVMYVGTQGNSGLILGAPAAGVPVTRPELVLGVATENITLNATGYVTCFGLVRSINTTGAVQGESWLDGDVLYYNPLVIGGLTKVRPTAPNPIVTIGNVVNAAASGSIFVRVHHGSTFGYSDGNVQITSPQNNDFVVYDSSQSRWENYSAANARTALGLGTAATTASTSYATSTQGVKADTALQAVPIATTTVLGGVKQGSGVTIAADGTLSASGVAASAATSSTQGVIQLTGDLAGTASSPTVPGLNGKQATLISGTNIKTVGGNTLLGSGDVPFPTVTPASIGAATAAQGTLASTALQQATGDARYVRTVNGTGPDGSGNVVVAGGSGAASFSTLTGAPTDNVALTTALTAKVDKATAGTTVTVSGNMSPLHVGKVVTVDTTSAAVVLTMVPGVIATASDRIAYKRKGGNTLSFASANGATLNDPHLIQIVEGDLVIIAGTALDTATVAGMPGDMVRKGRANTYTARQAIAPATLTVSGGNIAVDSSLSNNFTLSLTANATLLNPTALIGGQAGTIDVINTGAFNLSYGTMWRPVVGATTSVKQGAGGFSIITFKVSADGTKILFNVIQEQ